MAKMNDQVPSRLNDIFLKIDLYDPTSKFQELEICSDLTFMQSRFFTNLKNVKLSKQAQNLSYRFFKNFGSKWDLPLQINCEIFNMELNCGCPVSLARKQEEIRAFLLFFHQSFSSYFVDSRLKISLNRVWKYCYLHQSDFINLLPPGSFC